MLRASIHQTDTAAGALSRTGASVTSVTSVTTQHSPSYLSSLQLSSYVLNLGLNNRFLREGPSPVDSSSDQGTVTQISGHQEHHRVQLNSG